mgnify:CR=1 FL=1
MQCPVCVDKDGKPTGNLELVSALSISISASGELSRTSAVLLDEYLACNNCHDTQCDAEDCVGWHWEQSGSERRIKLEPPTTSPTESIIRQGFNINSAAQG